MYYNMIDHNTMIHTTMPSSFKKKDLINFVSRMFAQKCGERYHKVRFKTKNTIEVAPRNKLLVHYLHFANKTSRKQKLK